MKYILLSGTTMESLVGRVNDKLKDGWKLQGGVAALDISTEYAYFQAMTKEAK